MAAPDHPFNRFSNKSWLRMKKRPRRPVGKPVRSVDLFAGCGGLSLGVTESCRRLGLNHSIELASDWDERAISIFSTNLRPNSTHIGDIKSLFDGEIGQEKLTSREMETIAKFPNAMKPDILSGGPPCQGHSDLNNHTRRGDPRNSLYLRMVRATEILSPNCLIIENVPTVIHSKERVVQIATEHLMNLGYFVESNILWANKFGVPQKRKRHFLVASKIRKPDFGNLEELGTNKDMTLRWAIEDLEDSYDSETVFDSSATPSKENQNRMNWLIENEQWNLPNILRPPCHQQGHNYPAVYGRMYWDQPCSTITRGFGSTGQGRFMHPAAYPGRTLTPHEAARVQTFPDWFNFKDQLRGTVSKMIGNAVPPLLAMHISMIAIESIILLDGDGAGDGSINT
jgi:DNA (cytosine-5)-methyltransferase 1